MESTKLLGVKRCFPHMGIIVPFWVPEILGTFFFSGDPTRDPHFDNHTYGIERHVSFSLLEVQVSWYG